MEGFFMKKVLTCMLCAALALSAATLAGCGGGGGETGKSTVTETSADAYKRQPVNTALHDRTM